MEYKCILKVFLTSILIIAILNISYADSGPDIGQNQAKSIAQNYLNSHNLPYTAITPSFDAWKVKVKDTKTGGIKWIPASEAKADAPGLGGPGRYVSVNYKPGQKFPDSYDSTNAWVVQVNNKNGKNVGRIYVDSVTGKVLKAILNQESQTKKDTSTPTNTTNATNSTDSTNQTYPEQNNQSGLPGTMGIILATAIIAIALGFGYWKFNGK